MPRSPFDAYLAFACGAVIVLNVIAAAMAAVGACASYLASLLWGLTLLVFVVAVLLPALLSLLKVSLGARNVRWLVCAATAFALPIVVSFILPRSLASLGHCVA